MTYERLQEWIDDYFPEAQYTREEVQAYLNEHIPAWSHIRRREQKGILNDWEEFVLSEYQEEWDATTEQVDHIRETIEGKPRGFIARLKRLLGRLFK